MYSANEFDIIRKPLISEKTNTFKEKNKYVFKVCPRANKSQIKKAIQKIFKVTVISVNIINYGKKEKIFRNIKGFKSSFKKAIITTDANKKIDFEKGV